jgi:pilus assembly protein CpaC
MVVFRWLGSAGAVVASALVWGCASTTAPEPEDVVEQRPAQEWRSDGWGTSGRAVEEGIAKQSVPAGGEYWGRRATTDYLPPPGEAIWIQSGKSRILQFNRPVQRVSIGNPDIAGVVVLGPQTVMVNAKVLPKPQGSQEASAMELRLATVSNRPFTAEPLMAETTLAVWEAGAPQPAVRTVVVGESTNQQVLLEVTVAEINRTALEDHGIDVRQIGEKFASAYFLGGGVIPFLNNTVPPQIAQPLLPLGIGANGPNYVFQIPNSDITGFITLLQREGLASILAQPKILAMSGQPAVFQVGGEIPIRIVSGFAADVQFKPFGTLVNFIPRVSDEGDIVLTVTPEVSQPDFANEVEGVPSFITRRASTSARLRNGETLVVGGLLQDRRIERVRGVPYLMNIPLLGYVFRNTGFDREKTELLIIVTPRLATPMPPGTEMALPTDRGPLTFGEMKTQRDPAEVTRPRVPEVLYKPAPPW